MTHPLDEFDPELPRPPRKPRTTTITPARDSLLEQLCAQYDHAYAQAKKAEEHLDNIIKSIKAELVAAAPGELLVNLKSHYLERPLEMTARFQRRLKSAKLKADHPELYEEYVREISFWALGRKKT